MEKLSKFIVKMCFAITNAVGSIPAFVITILALIFVYALLFIQGFVKWNDGVGLFSNTFGSDVELITGIGSMVMLNVLHKAHKKNVANKNTLEHHGEALARIEKHLGIKSQEK
jgi:hypothetical protein